MNITKVWIGEKLYAEYPDCTIWIEPNSPFVYILPEGVSVEDKREKFVFVFPATCTNVSVSVIKQEDQP
jgi:hypothetical protein